MNQSEIDAYKQTLGRYLPHEAVDSVFNFMEHHRVQLHITKQRKSKLGDYRWPQPRHPYHEISINGDLNRYLFLWVLLHEMAHLNCHIRYNNQAKPHGHEWQEEYRQLILAYVNCFPTETTDIIKQYCRSIPLHHPLLTQIESSLRRYNPGYSQEEERLTLDDLMPGMEFCIAGQSQMRFVANEKRRTRWKCKNLIDGKEYLVRGSAEVEIIQS